MILLDIKSILTSDPFNASDPKTAEHHWFPFLRYKEKCESEGREPTVTEWLKSKGKLDHQIEYEAVKAKAIEDAAIAAKKKEEEAAAKLKAQQEDKLNNESKDN